MASHVPGCSQSSEGTCLLAEGSHGELPGGGIAEYLSFHEKAPLACPHWGRWS